MTTRSGARRSDDGFTLVEVVVAMALLLVISTTVFRAFASSTRTVTSLQTMIEAQGKARIALADLQADLRNAYSGSDTVARVVSMGAATITFTSADRETPLHLRRITYALSSGVLTRAVETSTNTYTAQGMTWTWPAGSPTAIAVANGVQNTTLFVFKDATGVVTTDVAKVRLVEVTLTVKDPTAKANQLAETYSTSVRIRGTG
jgi:prepilin-type N-terminal cleavage/methylation domain-containing protein